MRYVCVHCEHRWEVEGETPMRCPNCMRATGVKELRAGAEPAGKPAKGRGALVAAGIVVVLGGAAATYFATRDKDPVALSSEQRPLDEDELTSLLKHEQVDAGKLTQLLAPSDAIERFAEQAAKSAESPSAKAKAITDALRARAKKNAFIPWSLGEPRTTEVMVAADTLKALEKDNGRAELYPLEVAALAVSALRTVDAPALLAELAEAPNERAPLDSSGYLGYFVVALKDAQGKTQLFDPYGGRALKGDEKHALLSDSAAVGAALGLRAIHEVAYLGDPRSALASSSSALRLASSLPSVRTGRGVIVLAGKMIEQGLAEFSAASQLRADAPRLHNLASAKLMTGDIEAAEAELTRALQKSPDFGAAHASLAALSMLRGELEAARASFDKAERLAPDLSLVQWGRAEYLLRSGDRDGALERARTALARRPSFDAKIRLAVLLRQAGRYDEMREVAHDLVKRSPEYRKGDVRELLTTVLGPTALDPIEPDPDADDLADLGGPDLKLELGQPGKLELGQPDKLELGQPLGGQEPRYKLKLGEP